MSCSLIRITAVESETDADESTQTSADKSTRNTQTCLLENAQTSLLERVNGGLGADDEAVVNAVRLLGPLRPRVCRRRIRPCTRNGRVDRRTSAFELR